MDAATVISLSLSVVALVVSVWAGREAALSRRRDDDRDARAEHRRVEAQRRSQAEQVGASLTTDGHWEQVPSTAPASTFGLPPAELQWRHRALISVRNDSASTITDVDCEVPALLVDMQSNPTAVQGQIVPPGGRDFEVLETPYDLDKFEQQVRITFTDVNGVRWERSAAGVLTEVQ